MQPARRTGSHALLKIRHFVGFQILLEELPVPIVLAVVWLAGLVLMGLFVMALYLFWLLLRVGAGA
jgi:fatty acid desaturase